MNTVKVYRYDYYDSLLKRDRRSVDYATGDAIGELGGKILADTMHEVDERLLEDDGMIRASMLFSEAPPPKSRPEPRARA